MPIHHHDVTTRHLCHALKTLWIRTFAVVVLVATVGSACGTGDEVATEDAVGSAAPGQIMGLPDSMAFVGDDLVVAKYRPAAQTIQVARHQGGATFDEVGVVRLDDDVVATAAVQMVGQGDETLLVGNGCTDKHCETSRVFGYSISGEGAIDRVPLPDASQVWLLGAGNGRTWLNMDSQVVEVATRGVRTIRKHETNSCVSPDGKIVAFGTSTRSVLEGDDTSKSDEVEVTKSAPVDAGVVVQVDGTDIANAIMPFVGMAEVRCAQGSFEVTDTSSDLWERFSYEDHSFVSVRPDGNATARVPATGLSASVATDGTTAWTLGSDGRPLSVTPPKSVPGSMSPTAADDDGLFLPALATSIETKLALCWAGEFRAKQDTPLKPAHCERTAP